MKPCQEHDWFSDGRDINIHVNEVSLIIPDCSLETDGVKNLRCFRVDAISEVNCTGHEQCHEHYTIENDRERLQTASQHSLKYLMSKNAGQ